jgi:hypothetical protein
MKNHQQINFKMESSVKLNSFILILLVLGASSSLLSKADPYYPSYNPNYYGNPYQMQPQQNPNNAYGYTSAPQAIPGMLPDAAYMMQAMLYSPMGRNLPGFAAPVPQTYPSQAMGGMQRRELKPNQQVVDILGARIQEGSKTSNSSNGTNSRGFWKRN